MKFDKITIALLLIFILYSCAPPLRKYVPIESNFRKEETLCITLKDRSEHKIKFLKADETGIYSHFDKYYAFKNIVFIEREKFNTSNVGLMLVGGVAVIAVIGVYHLYKLPDELQNKLGNN